MAVRMYDGSIMSECHDIRYLVPGSWRIVELLHALSGKEKFVDNYERSTSKRPTPAPSLHWMQRLVLLNGTREPRSQALVVSSNTSNAHACANYTMPQTTEYGRSVPSVLINA